MVFILSDMRSFQSFVLVLKLLAVCFLFSSGSLLADVKLPAIFSDHMVLKSDENVPLWGNADPGEEVTVSMDGQTVKAVAGADGKWKAALNLKRSKPGPFDMTVSGKNAIKISDVVVGEVWLASGQSNMFWKLNVGEYTTQGGAEESAHSANPMLRVFDVPQVANAQLQDNCGGSWVVAGPATSGQFSAIGYYFAKKLQNELKVPVGLIDSTWGGTMIEPWTSTEAPETDAEFQGAKQAKTQRFEEYPAKKQRFIVDFTAWLKASNREDKPVADAQAYAAPGISTAGWTWVKLPGSLSTAGLPANGAVWLRREITIPQDKIAGLQAVGQSLRISLGPITSFESIYWNGELVWQLTPDKIHGIGFDHYVDIPATRYKPGANTLAVRIFAPVAPIEFPNAPIIWTYTLDGPWLAKAEYALPPLDAAALASVPQLPVAAPDISEIPGFIFNGMINPLVPYALSGVLWYQGESSVGLAYLYRHELALLIADWRQHWGNPGLPFYVCQLSGMGSKSTDPNAASSWAEMRESQGTALKLPHAGQAVLVDLGESENIHYYHKREAGDRLALIALAQNYGENVPFSGPIYSSMKVEDGKIRIQFDHVEGGLVARPLEATYPVNLRAAITAPLVRNSPKSDLEGFAICGDDHKWIWADAKIDGDSVVVWSDNVPKPVAVRYAWADNPICNLYNGVGLPASPFRTDNFPVSTQDRKYR